MPCIYRAVKAGNLPSDEGRGRAFILHTLGDAEDIPRALPVGLSTLQRSTCPPPMIFATQIAIQRVSAPRR